MPELCLVIAALLLPLSTASATEYEAKELFKIYAHTKLVSSKEYYCIEKLWNLESRWDPLARNKKSSARGIPQILGLKETNPYRQIDKGIEYIVHRYGTPCKAYIHHKKVGHY